MPQPNTAAEKVAELLALIGDRETFVVTSHARPDGDAIGSALGVMHLLEALGKHVTVAFADTIPAIYCALPGADRIVRTVPSTPTDAAILLECDSFQRAGYTAEDFAACAFTINIDHHLSGKPYADYNWIDPQCCAVGAMIYDVAVTSGIEIDCHLATCLYTAVLTDTGSFTYASTVASTFALAEHLVRAGANPNSIAQAVYFSNPASKLYLLARALTNLHVDGPIAWSWITLHDIEEAGANLEDCEGVVNYLINIEGVEAATFLRELPADAGYRLSMRSKSVADVAQVAASLGGGGHRNASGCNVAHPLAQTLDIVLTKLREAVPPTFKTSKTPELC